MKLLEAVRTRGGFRLAMHLDEEKSLPGRLSNEAVTTLHALIDHWRFVGDQSAAILELLGEIGAVIKAGVVAPTPDPEWIYSQEYGHDVDPKSAVEEFQRLCDIEHSVRAKAGEPLDLGR